MMQTDQVVITNENANRVIIAQGGAFGGWTLYAKNGRQKYCYSFLGIRQLYAESSACLACGKRQVRMEFAYEAADLERAGADDSDRLISPGRSWR